MKLYYTPVYHNSATNILYHITLCQNSPSETYTGRNVHVCYLWQKWLCNKRITSCKFQDITVPSRIIIYIIIHKLRQHRIRGTQIFQKSRTKLKILRAWMVTWSNLPIQDPKILVTTVQNLVTFVIWHLGFVHPWTGSLLDKKEFIQATPYSVTSCTKLLQGINIPLNNPLHALRRKLNFQNHQHNHKIEPTEGGSSWEHVHGSCSLISWSTIEEKCSYVQVLGMSRLLPVQILHGMSGHKQLAHLSEHPNNFRVVLNFTVGHSWC